MTLLKTPLAFVVAALCFAYAAPASAFVAKPPVGAVASKIELVAKRSSSNSYYARRAAAKSSSRSYYARKSAARASVRKTTARKAAYRDQTRRYQLRKDTHKQNAKREALKRERANNRLRVRRGIGY